MSSAVFGAAPGAEAESGDGEHGDGMANREAGGVTGRVTVGVTVGGDGASR